MGWVGPECSCAGTDCITACSPALARERRLVERLNLHAQSATLRGREQNPR